jgi:ribonuclease BN (tRNA processing enzyme)
VESRDNQEAMGDNEKKMITGTIDAAQMAKQTGAKRLILAHQGPNLVRPGSKEKAISDISKIFNNQIIFAEELMALEI